MIKIGKYNAGTLFAERIFSLRSWRRYGLFSKLNKGVFTIGPVLFWRSRL